MNLQIDFNRYATGKFYFFRKGVATIRSPEVVNHACSRMDDDHIGFKPPLGPISITGGEISLRVVVPLLYDSEVRKADTLSNNSIAASPTRGMSPNPMKIRW